ncbi:hypothetical protein N7468_000072 [Penicillium chermesinum]|uniref:ABC transporter n=1 Tax=Penicillium chermesinum TaxID=63820 RepID=A0A9W9PJN6_9EURO|nr:uncharacterized protein N7468_000072 [Penicillium chermesinum]KAJ5248621.1 hypothetical protein N7468_000072 [Penicillium chermesinum]KAJ6150731.1 hypothetical protein N7470_007325 [Penicillium chermesinum]
MTDTCGKATLLTLYQASDAIYELMDKVLVIDKGRMIFQGPACAAKQYFEDLGYECAEMQTTSDFLTSITLPERRKFPPGWEHRAPKGRALELEAAFKNIEISVEQYDIRQTMGSVRSNSEQGSVEELKRSMQSDKSSLHIRPRSWSRQP